MSGLTSSVVLYALLVVSAALVCGLIAGYSWRRRSIRGAKPLTVTMTGAAVWNGCTATQLLIDNWGFVATLQAVKLGGVGLAVGGLLALALEFSGSKAFVDRRLGALLAVEPVAIVLLAATNRWHGLVWTSLSSASSTFDTVAGEMAVAFWLHTVYSYALIAVAIGLLIVAVARSRSIYRKQVAVVLAGALMPAVANITMMVGILSVNLQPFAFVLTGIVIVWGIRRYHLIDLVPIARDHVVDTLPHPVVVLDESNRITDVNEAGRALLETTGAVVGTNFQDAFDAYPHLVEQLDDAVQTTVPIELTVADSVRHFEVHCSTVGGGPHDAAGRVLLLHDVTERVTNRRELERQNDQLEQFASVVSHDLRNPLSVAEGYLDLARESGDPADFEAVEESLQRMNAIIDDVLTLAREGSMIEERSPVSIDAVAKTAWEQVETGDGQLRIDDDCTVDADEDRLQRVFENLFRNAVEHAESAYRNGPGHLTVTVGPIAPDGPDSSPESSQFGFFVEDDGVGIAEDRREEIFDPGNSSSTEGTGLGLSIVRGIAEAHGWSVRATAAENGGARFEFTGAQWSRDPEAASEATDAGAQR